MMSSLTGTSAVFTSPLLTSTLVDGNIACANREVIFYCTVTGSILSWRSGDYIGLNSPLQISSGRIPGYNITSPQNMDTVATLLANNVTSMVLITQLRIIPLLNYSTSSVVCENAERSEKATINFTTVMGKWSQNCYTWMFQL